MASFAPATVFGVALQGVAAGDLVSVSMLNCITGSDGGTYAPAAAIPPPATRPHDPNCHHCGAPPEPGHPEACRFCGTERS